MNKVYNISKPTVEFTFLMLVDGPDKKMKQEANNFSTICPENIYHITVRLHCQNTTTTGVWEKLWHCIFCISSLMAAILYHMTFKLLGQIKVDKMYLCINFHPLFL